MNRENIPIVQKQIPRMDNKTVMNTARMQINIIREAHVIQLTPAYQYTNTSHVDTTHFPPA